MIEKFWQREDAEREDFGCVTLHSNWSALRGL
jgi:hypothetical protein